MENKQNNIKNCRTQLIELETEIENCKNTLVELETEIIEQCVKNLSKLGLKSDDENIEAQYSYENSEFYNYGQPIKFHNGDFIKKYELIKTFNHNYKGCDNPVENLLTINNLETLEQGIKDILISYHKDVDSFYMKDLTDFFNELEKNSKITDFYCFATEYSVRFGVISIKYGIYKKV